MYECPNCAGNLKFDIARQQLYCAYCDTQVDPYGFCREKDAEEACFPGENGEYEVTVFTCPQCGGEILGGDTTAATFCSFCGSSAILDSRISKKRRPGYIIPFTVTKEDCRAAYAKLLRRAFFAPKELKDGGMVEKFRGIYMPYWVYSFGKKGGITFLGRKSRRRGDYVVTDHYRLESQVEEEYRGLAYDASASFSDSLSSAIAPFDLKAGKQFVPAFLSGFYADTNDVEKYVYLQEAEEMVLQDTVRQLGRDSVCRKYKAGQDLNVLRNALRPSCKTAELAMLPVWFLSYRNGDRVSYAVVNGQTGKAAADLPVDGKKYLLGSLFLAVPLFFLLNLFLTITPTKILLIAAFLALLCILISNAQISHILARESGEDDKGLSSIRPSSGMGNQGRRGRRRRPVSSFLGGAFGKVLLVLGLFYATALLPTFFRYLIIALGGREGMGSGKTGLYMAVVILAAAGINGAFILLGGGRGAGKPGKKPFGGGHFREKWPTLAKPFGGILLAAVILIVDPVSDWFYYTGAFVCMGTVLWAIMDIIKQHNLLTTRKLPQLGRRGGDENG